MTAPQLGLSPGTLVHLLQAALLLAVAVLYAVGLRRLWTRGGRGSGITTPQAAAFYAGVVTLAIAVLSPLDALAHELFSAHMAQHMLMILLAAPLLVYAAPGLVALWALPSRPRRTVASHFTRGRPLRRLWALLTTPVITWTLFASVLWIWHLPSLYQSAILHPYVHALEHATMLAAAFLLWWPILQPVGRRRLGYAPAMLYVFLTSLQGTLLGALMTFAPEPLYPVYAVTAALHGVDPLHDQYLAGLVMRTPGAVVWLATVAILFLKLMRQLERRADGERVPT